jgi:N-acetylglucosaminyldiphosphoundecaprenol N-acetyl-beta-D-mannosaminyltransferase
MTMNDDFIDRRLFGLKIKDTSKSYLYNLLLKSIISNQKLSIYGLCAGSLSRIKNKKKELPQMLEKFDIVIADGGSIPILGKIFGVPIREQIAITELAISLLEMANDNKYKVQLFGASQESNSMAIEKLKIEYPNVEFGPGINGYFRKDQIPEIIQNINIFRPNILLIGMTYPLKEKFTVEYQDKLEVNIILPCGGAIDIFSGKTKRPKYRIKYLPLTWLFRWIQEPRRLSIKPDLRFLCLDFPVLLIKHVLRIERNPSLLKHYKLL